jgi:hypothetical protein
MKYVTACLLSSVFFSTVIFSHAFADHHERKKVVVKEKPLVLKSGVTKEQHMAAEAACREIKSSMNGKELKVCVKEKLGLSQ